MSYVALATERFDEVTRFYGETLGLPNVGGYDRTNGRGREKWEVLGTSGKSATVDLPHDR